jgi:hypothetical protein
MLQQLARSFNGLATALAARAIAAIENFILEDIRDLILDMIVLKMVKLMIRKNSRDTMEMYERLC